MYAWRNDTKSSNVRINTLSRTTGKPIPTFATTPAVTGISSTKRGQHDVPGNHVRKQTNRQRERLDQRADSFPDTSKNAHIPASRMRLTIVAFAPVAPSSLA